MPIATSPLRYPGGKTALLETVAETMRLNKIDRGQYIEPYAGGGGLALSLLFAGHVSSIHLNDVDVAIAALWRAMLERSEDLIEMMEAVPITVEEWERQRFLYLAGHATDPMELALATLFLNRTNRSGIIKTGGIIGGRAQAGKYLIDCRFNKQTIAARIRRIAKYRKRIVFTSEDALDFIRSRKERPAHRSFIFIDPPYFKAGADLYTSFYRPEDHLDVAEAIGELDRPWMLTYDTAPEIMAMYKNNRQFRFDQLYSAQKKRTGVELMIVSKGLRLPAAIRERQSHRPQYRCKASDPL
ncbi:MAG: DNA adenine methylase [Planctomycetota bacterium]